MDQEPPVDSFPEGERRFTDARGLHISYLEWGEADAPPLLLLHGLAVEAHGWDPLASLLAEDAHLIAPDLRGHGESANPEPPSYSTRDFVDDAAALVESVGLNRVAVLGHSLGALIGIALAATHPELVERLIIVDTAPLAGASKGPPWAVLPSYPSFDELLSATAGTYPRTPPGLVQHLARHNAIQLPDRTWTRRHAADLQLLKLAPTWPLVADVRCPTLIVRGSLSTVFNVDDARRLAAEIDGAHLLTIEGAGHPIAQEMPAELATLVREFMKGA